MSYFFQRKKYIKKESFPFFLTKISDFGVKDKKIARIFDSLHLLFENLRFSRRETKSREENVPFSLNTREIGSLGSMGAVRALEIAHFWAYFSLISVKFSEFHVIFVNFSEKLSKISENK